MTIANTTSRSWTHSLSSDNIVIDSDFGLTIISILCTSGTISIVGEVAANGVPSTPIILDEGKMLTIDSGSAALISGITIDASSGVANLVGR